MQQFYKNFFRSSEKKIVKNAQKNGKFVKRSTEEVLRERKSENCLGCKVLD